MAKVLEWAINGYLVFLALFCVGYGIWVILKGGAFANSIYVNVILPPDLVDYQNATAFANLNAQLGQLNQTAVNGVVLDVWWGLVETSSHGYNWSLYDPIFALLSNYNSLKVKVNLAFHQYSSSTFNVSLPSWVQAVGEANPDIYHSDVHGNRNMEYLSIGVDYKPVFPSGRTGVELYIDFIQSFVDQYTPYFDTLIYEIQIGLGPDGELRYPAFAPAMWSYPGVGEFQCYDKYLMAEYNTTATKNGHANWGYLPNATGVSYNALPSQVPFFNKGTGGYLSDYGQFFLNWYSSRLIQHGQSILGNAATIIGIVSPNVSVSAKVGCVYWQFKDPSHAAELCAGYKNDGGQGYLPIAQMFKNLDVIFNFACFDLSNQDMAANTGASASPEDLVQQTLAAATNAGVDYEGHNTIEDSTAFAVMEHNIKKNLAPIVGFDYSMLSDELMNNLDNFENFVYLLNNPSKI